MKMGKMGTVAGHQVVLARVTLHEGGMEIRLIRRWWAPLPLAWIGAGTVAWWLRPAVFFWLLGRLTWSFACEARR